MTEKNQNLSVTGKKITQHTPIMYFDVWYVTDDDMRICFAFRAAKKNVQNKGKRSQKDF